MANYKTSDITTSYITVWWNHPFDSALVQSYVVRLTEYWGSIDLEEFAGRDTNFTFESNFTPGYLFYFEIVSTVLLIYPMELINVTTTTRIPLVVGIMLVNFRSVSRVKYVIGKNLSKRFFSVLFCRSTPARTYRHER